MTWLKHKYYAFQLLIAAVVTGDLDGAATQLGVLLGEEV